MPEIKKNSQKAAKLPLDKSADQEKPYNNKVNKVKTSPYINKTPKQIIELACNSQSMFENKDFINLKGENFLKFVVHVCQPLFSQSNLKSTDLLSLQEELITHMIKEKIFTKKFHYYTRLTIDEIAHKIFTELGLTSANIPIKYKKLRDLTWKVLNKKELYEEVNKVLGTKNNKSYSNVMTETKQSDLNPKLISDTSLFNWNIDQNKFSNINKMHEEQEINKVMESIRRSNDALGLPATTSNVTNINSEFKNKTSSFNNFFANKNISTTGDINNQITGANKSNLGINLAFASIAFGGGLAGFFIAKKGYYCRKEVKEKQEAIQAYTDQIKNLINV